MTLQKKKNEIKFCELQLTSGFEDWYIKYMYMLFDSLLKYNIPLFVDNGTKMSGCQEHHTRQGWNFARRLSQDPSAFYNDYTGNDQQNIVYR